MNDFLTTHRSTITHIFTLIGPYLVVWFAFLLFYSIRQQRALRAITQAIMRRNPIPPRTLKTFSFRDKDYGELTEGINELITENRELRHLRTSQLAQLDATLGNLQEAVLIIDADNTILLANKALRSIFPDSASALHQRFEHVIHSAAFLEYVTAVRAGTALPQQEIAFISPRETRWVEVTGATIPPADGEGGGDEKNPNGVPSSSPGLPESARATLGLDKQTSPTPTGLRPPTNRIRPQPRWGCESLPSLSQGSPRGLGQPWAGGHNAVGVDNAASSPNEYRREAPPEASPKTSPEASPKTSPEASPKAPPNPAERNLGALRDSGAHAPRNATGANGPWTLFVLHDITRQKKLEAIRKDFVANVSHELRTPLSLVKGCAETLVDGHRDMPVADREKFLLTIQRHSERLDTLIEDLLTLSRLESANPGLQLEPVPFAQFVSGIIADYRARPAAAAHTINLTIAPDIGEVSIDPRKITQVFENLINNALKYTPAGSRIDITATLADALDAGSGGLQTAGRGATRLANERHLDAQTKEGRDFVASGGLETAPPWSRREIEVCVRDNGSGIPAADLPHMFERFYRVDKARSRETGGTGLGLSIVKHIVQLHGGRVRVESDYGRGAAFFFTLPV